MAQSNEKPTYLLDSLERDVLHLLQTDKYYEALRKTEEYKKIALLQGNQGYVASSEHLVSLTYLQLFAFEKSEKHIQRAISINLKRGDKDRLANNYAQLAHINVLGRKYSNCDIALKKAKYYDSLTNNRIKFYNYETLVMKLFKEQKFDSLVSISELTLEELRNTEPEFVADPSYTNQETRELIKLRLHITFELFQCYGYFEKNKNFAFANQKLNILKDKELEKILWFSPRVYEHYYRINNYKASISLNAVH